MSPIERSGGGGGASAGGLVKLFDQTLGASAASIDTGAGGIAAGHTDLLVLAVTKTDEAVELSGLDMRLNNDSGANYSRSFVATSTLSTTPIANMVVNETSIIMVTAGASFASAPGVLRMFIPSYEQTTFFKTAEWAAAATDPNTAANANRQWGLEQTIWKNTAAITRMSIFPDTAGKNLVTGSRLVIYGMQ